MVEHDPVGHSEVTGRATTGGNHRALLVVAAGVVAILAALALLSRTGGADDSRSDAGADQSLPTLPGFFTTTSAISATGPAAATGADGGNEAGAVAPTTMVPGEFVLGEPTGLWLFYGGRDPLQRLDLDTGQLVQYGLQAVPVLATGEDVVLYQADSQVSGWVSAADPGEQALNWKSGPVALGPAGGRLWILDPSTDLEHPSGEPVGFGRWELFDTTANRVLDRRPGDLHADVETLYAQGYAIGGRFEVLRPGPDFSSRPDGVYEYGESGYRKLGPGRVMAYDALLALIEVCPGPGDCRYSWLDRESGLPAEGPVPDGPIVSAELLGGGRWLHTVGSEIQSGIRSELIDIETGDRIDLGSVRNPTISPDGRWLATRSGDSLTVLDLLNPTRPVATLQGFVGREGGDLLFVDQPLKS